MAGPWEDFQPQAPQPGPWTAFAQLAPQAPIRVPLSNPMGGPDLSPQMAQPQQPPPNAPSGLQSFAYGMQEPGAGIIQGAGHLLQIPQTAMLDRMMTDRNTDYEKSRGEDAGFDWGRSAGNVVGSIPAAIGATMLAPEAGATMLGAAGLGVANGMMAPVYGNSDDYARQKLAQGLIGGLTGGLVKGGANVLGGVPVTQQVQTMLDSKVYPTIGQILGAPKFESMFDHFPIIGDAIKKGQAGAIDDMNTAFANKILAPIGQTVDAGVKVGRDMWNNVYNKISNAYDSVLPKLTFTADNQMQNELAALQQQVKADLVDPVLVDKFNNAVQGSILNKLNANNQMTGEMFRVSDSSLGKRFADMANGSVPDDKALVPFLAKAQDILRQTMARTNQQTNPQAAAQYQGAVDAFRQWKTIERAAGNSNLSTSDLGALTPKQLAAGLLRQSGAADVATGSAENQPFVDAAVKVLGDKYPDSGTAGRLSPELFGSAAVLGHEAGALPMGAILGYGGAGLAAHGIYSDAGRKAIAMMLTQRPDFLKLLGKGLTVAAPSTGLLGASALPTQP